jgi:hypothetical protein
MFKADLRQTGETFEAVRIEVEPGATFWVRNGIIVAALKSLLVKAWRVPSQRQPLKCRCQQVPHRPDRAREPAARPRNNDLGLLLLRGFRNGWYGAVCSVFVTFQQKLVKSVGREKRCPVQREIISKTCRTLALLQ